MLFVLQTSCMLQSHNHNESANSDNNTCRGAAICVSTSRNAWLTENQGPEDKEMQINKNDKNIWIRGSLIIGKYVTNSEDAHCTEELNSEYNKVKLYYV